MRILWICAESVEAGVPASASGHWKSVLYESLRTLPDITLVAASPGLSCAIHEHGLASFRFPLRHGDAVIPKVTVNDLRQIVEAFRPDIIHVHGTETTLGQVVEHTTVPVVVSLQGFISESYDAVMGGIPAREWRRFRSLREAVSGGGFPGLQSRWRRSSSGEIRVLTHNRHFIGRTDFDHRVLRRHNPSAQYYYGREMLRPCFRPGSWDRGTCTRNRIYCPGFSNPLKGFHILLDAVAELTETFPDIHVATPGRITPRSRSLLLGNGYHRLLEDRILRLGLKHRIAFHGRLDGQAVQRELLAANVTVIPSLIENSSNTLGEAMMVGCPSVISRPCGGLQSLLGSPSAAHEFAQGDAHSLADSLRVLLSSGEYADALSLSATSRALQLHDPTQIPAEYLGIYERVTAA